MKQEIIQTIIMGSIFLFGMWIAYWAGNEHGFKRGYKRGISTAKAIAKTER